MKRCSVIVLVAVLTMGITQALMAAPAFDQVAPADTMAFISVRNLPELSAKIKAHPIHAMWREPSVQQFLERPLRRITEEIQKAEGQAGVTVSDVWSVFRGGIAVMVNAPAEGTEPEVLFLADVGDRGEQAMNLARALWTAVSTRAAEQGQTLRTVEQTIEGARFISLMPPEGQPNADQPALTYGVAGDVLIAGHPLAAVTRMVGTLRNPPAAPLAGSAAYQGAMGKVDGSPDFFAYGNIARIIAAALQRQPNPNAAQVVQALGLNGLSTLSMAVDMHPDHTASRIFMQTSGAPQGIVKILMPPPGALHSGAEVPADASGFLSARFDPAAIWDEVERILGATAPQVLAGINAQINQAAQQTGQPFSLRNDVFAVFGPRAGFYTRYEKPYNMATSQQAVFMFDIASKAAFMGTLEKLQRIVPPLSALLKPREYMGYQLFVFQAPGMPTEGAEGANVPQPAIAVMETEMIFSTSMAAIEAHLRRVGRTGESLRERAVFQEGLAKLPDDGRVMISFSDPRPQVEFALAVIREGQMMPLIKGLQENPSTAEIMQLFDFSQLPNAAEITRHLSPTVSTTLVRPDGLLVLSRTPAKTAEGN